MVAMTDEQRAELTRMAAAMRRIAQPVGPMHGLWDHIFDIEAVLAGREALLTKTPEEWIAFTRPTIKALGITTT
ncbi:hypothetical protein CHR62_09205 [Pusillimonas sp. NJUB218]|nr:hypothetical protein CHR62_09205 [Pusillimonas sp. NJUB218]